MKKFSTVKVVKLTGVQATDVLILEVCLAAYVLLLLTLSHCLFTGEAGSCVCDSEAVGRAFPEME